MVEFNALPVQKDSLKIMHMKSYTNWELKLLRNEGESVESFIDRVNESNAKLEKKYENKDL